ncbi:MAG: hypothetical protein MK025_11645, partial [Acidobacteriia bacterium]|nr:hypothetical protein [Terriglobia bacterium]
MDFILLLINTFWLIGLTLLVGWCLYPRGFIHSALMINTILWIALGNATLVLVGLLLVRLNYAGENIFYLIPVILIYRLLQYFIPWKFYEIVKLPPQWKSWSATSTLKGLLVLLVLVIVVFYFPFIYQNTSGYYAISGGDASLYLRVAEFYLENGFLADALEGLDKLEILPPYPNWNILTYVSALQKGSGYFSQSLTALPYMAFSLTTVDEGYMISLLLSFLLCVGGVPCLLGYLFAKGDSYIFSGAVVVTLSNLLLWMAASHAVPAFFVLGLYSLFVLLCIIGLQSGRAPVLALAIFGASMLHSYLPYFIVGPTIPIGLYIIYSFGILFFPRAFNKTNQGTPSSYLLNLGLSLGALLIAGFAFIFPEYERIVTMLSSAGFKGADFGLKNWHSLLSVTGSVDFDLLFPTSSLNIKWIVWYVGIPVSLFLFLGVLLFLKHANWILRVIFSSNLLVLTYFAWDQLGGSQTQYAGIRFAEMGSVFFAAAAGIGLLVAIKSYQHPAVKKVFYCSFALCLLGSLMLTGTLWARVLLWLPHDQSVIMDHNDYKMAETLEEFQSQDGNKERSVYWFGTGTGVTFAASEVLFRKVRYFEAFDYDYLNYVKTHVWYRGVELDILKEKYIKDAIFAIPGSWRKEIFRDMADLMSEPTWEYGENKIYDTNASSGFTFLGDAWNPPIPWQGDTWGRYLKGRPGGIVVWTTRPRTIVFEVSLTPLADDMGVIFSWLDGRVIKKIELNQQKVNSTFAFQVVLEPGINTIRVTPVGLSKKIPWGLTQRSETDWITFTEVVALDGAYPPSLAEESDGWVINGAVLKLLAKTGNYQILIEGNPHGDSVKDLSILLDNGQQYDGLVTKGKRRRAFLFEVPISQTSTQFKLHSNTPVIPRNL